MSSKYTFEIDRRKILTFPSTRLTELTQFNDNLLISMELNFQKRKWIFHWRLSSAAMTFKLLIKSIFLTLHHYRLK